MSPPRRREKGEESTANFRELNDAELYELSDEELIAYIVRPAPRAEPRPPSSRSRSSPTSTSARCIGFIQNQLGSKGPEVVEQVAARTIADAIAAAASFEGETIEEFRGFLFRIARRRRVDYLRKNRVDEVPLAWESEGGEVEREIDGGRPARRGRPRERLQPGLRRAAPSDSHKLVVLLTVFHDLTAKDVAEQVNRQFGAVSDDPMTEQNVNQINSRFRKRLDELLDD